MSLARLFFVLPAALLAAYNASAVTFSLSTPKRRYLRYELVRLRARIESSEGQPLKGLVPEIRCYREDSLVATDLGHFHLRYDDSSGTYSGGWPIPFNPEVGRYTLEVLVSLPNERFTLKNVSEIEVYGRIPTRIDTSICAMTIEAQTDLIKNPVSHPLTGRWDWRNYTTWADLLCANTILYSVGWSIEGKVTAEDPWIPEGPRTYGELALEAHRKGFKFGGWIGSFLIWGPPKLGLGYKYSWEFVDGKLRRNHHVSLDNRKRILDIARLARRMDADPNVDYVGFDYMRPGPGGLELVDGFVDSMDISTPENWHTLSMHGRMRWLGEALWRNSDPVLGARWEWWLAHKSASALAAILEESRLSKPVWIFMLGWDKGHEHGQDPIMLNDAGASFCAVMLYESTAKEEKVMIGQWSKYLIGDEVNLIVGEAVDWELMGKTKEPEAPQEFAIRLSGGIRGLTRDHPVCGLFWHDLTRTHWGSPGPYSRIEWVNAGAAAFTRLRSERLEIPFRARIAVGRKSARVVVENLTDNELEDLKVSLIQTPGVTLKDSRMKRVTRIRGSEKAVVPFGLRAENRSMVAFQIECQGMKGVFFEYYPNPYRNRPFRMYESVHAGGDVLVISQPSDYAFAVGRSLRNAGYSCNRISYQNLPRSVVRKFRHVVMIEIDLDASPGFAGEIAEYLADGGSGVFISCSGGEAIRRLGKGSFAAVDRTDATSVVRLIESPPGTGVNF